MAWKLVVLTCLAVLAAVGAMADDRDYQLRVLTHLKRVPNGRTGFGAWAVAPDVTTSPRKALFVGGTAWESGSSWIETMGGVFVSTTGRIEPVFNARAVANRARISVYGETVWNFRLRRLLISENVTAPVPFMSKFRIGAESDTIVGAGKPSFGAGPRVVAPVPFTRGRASLATAIQFRNRAQPPILRQYLSYRF